jgi:hypothetical protein
MENAGFPSEDGNASCLRLQRWTRVLTGPHSFFPSLIFIFFHGRNPPRTALSAATRPPPRPTLSAAFEPQTLRRLRATPPIRSPGPAAASYPLPIPPPWEDLGKVARGRRRPSRTNTRGGPLTGASSPVPTTATPHSFSASGVPHPSRLLPEMERLVGSDQLRGSGHGRAATFLLRLRPPRASLVRPRPSQGISRLARPLCLLPPARTGASRRSPPNFGPLRLAMMLLDCPAGSIGSRRFAASTVARGCSTDDRGYQHPWWPAAASMKAACSTPSGRW